MNLTEYQYQILDVLGLREAFDKIDPERVDARASVWNKAQRQLWATPQSFVDGVAAIADLKITVDLCAEKHTAKAPVWFGPGSPVGVQDAIGCKPDGLGGYSYRYWHEQVGSEDVLWCNPDFLRKRRWVKGLLLDDVPGFLLVPPATDQAWFGDLHEDPRCHLTVLEGRMRFEPPEGIAPSSPNGGTVLWQVNFDSPVLPLRLDWREVCEIGKAVGS